MRVALVFCVILAFLMLSLSASAHAQGTSDFGTVTVNFRPPTAEVFVDGERWVSPESSGPLVIQLAPGRHTVDVRAPGYRPFSTVVEVHRGEATPVNVILPAGPAGPPAIAPQPDAFGNSTGPIHQVSRTSTEDGFVFAPDFKITELNHRTTGFGGFYGGAVFAGQFMIGGGAYFQLDDYHHYNSEQMVYGGLVSEWRLFHDHPVGLTLHGLAGYGEAQLGNPYPVDGGNNGHVDPHHGGYYSGGYYGYGPYEGFFIGEPEAQVVARFGHGIRLVGGVGYRFTSADFNDLNGVTGSIAVQFGR
jgi:hypothetical protein